MCNAELHHKVEAWSTLTKLVVGAVALLLHKLSLLAHRGAVLAGVPPVPVFSKMPLRTDLALCGCVGGAVSLHSGARRALVAQQEVRGHRVAVLVLRQYVRLLKGPGERCCEKLQKKERSVLNTESTAVTTSLKKPISCTQLLFGIMSKYYYILQHSPTQSFQ